MGKGKYIPIWRKRQRRQSYFCCPCQLLGLLNVSLCRGASFVFHSYLGTIGSFRSAGLYGNVTCVCVRLLCTDGKARPASHPAAVTRSALTIEQSIFFSFFFLLLLISTNFIYSEVCKKHPQNRVVVVGTQISRGAKIECCHSD